MKNCECYTTSKTVVDCSERLDEKWGYEIWGMPVTINIYETGSKRTPFAMAYFNREYDRPNGVDMYEHMFGWKRIEHHIHTYGQIDNDDLESICETCNGSGQVLAWDMWEDCTDCINGFDEYGMSTEG